MTFFTDQKIQIVIDKYKNKQKKIEIKILQGSFIYLIFFLISISKVFDSVLKC